MVEQSLPHRIGQICRRKGIRRSTTRENMSSLDSSATILQTANRAGDGVFPFHGHYADAHGRRRDGQDGYVGVHPHGRGYDRADAHDCDRDHEHARAGDGVVGHHGHVDDRVHGGAHDHGHVCVDVFRP